MPVEIVNGVFCHQNLQKFVKSNAKFFVFLFSFSFFTVVVIIIVVSNKPIWILENSIN
jgi:hypothetical protein